jgi:hypothetical protein
MNVYATLSTSRLALSLILAQLPLAGLATAAPEVAKPADALADMVGIDTHLNYGGTVYDTHYGDIVKPGLVELGVRHIRDNPSTSATVQARWADLASAGIRLLLITPLAFGLPAAVEAVEPPNETDIQWGSAWPSRMQSWMTQNYPTYKAANPSLPVIGPSFANTRDSAPKLASAFPSASSSMDLGNLHDYSGTYPEGAHGGGWGISVDSALQRYATLSGGKPAWVTENGYKMSGSVSGHPAVTQRAAAKYLPRQLFWHLARGVQRYYVYQLINDREDFGLLNNDGSPRQQFTSVKNLIALYSDPGPAFAPGSLDYSLSGSLANVQHALFQKRDGRYYLALWLGVSSCSGTTDSTLRDIEATPQAVTVMLAAPAAQVVTWRPSFDASPEGTAANVSSVQTSVTDQITVLEITPAGAVAAPE